MGLGGATLCFGPLLIATVTPRCNCCQPPVRVSTPFGFFGAFAMTDEVPVRDLSSEYHMAIGVITRQRLAAKEEMAAPT